jgi:DNA-binding CsgD family transcriptional regulator
VAVTSAEPLIGRSRELKLLCGLVTEAKGGAAATALIEGEAGIGKTRLLMGLIDAARESGVTVFRGEAHALERTRPFGPLVDALELRGGSSDPRRAAIGRLLAGGEHTPGLAAQGALQFRAAEEIIDLLEVLSGRGPLLLAVEDIHWADSSTLVAFRWMTRRLEHVPLLLVATLRPSPRGAELRQLVADALATDASLVRLERLEDRDVAALVTAELGMPPGPALAEAVGRAGGNLLWVVELLRSLSSDGMLDLTGPMAEVTRAQLPESLRQLVVRRLGYLPEEALALLRVASVLGDAFSLADLAAITGRRVVDLVDDLDEAFRARLVGDHGNVVVFRHALVHEAIYRNIPEPARVALHREAGRALAAAGAPLTRVAGHVFLGAVPGDMEAVDALRSAAREAVSRAPGVAVELLRRAETLLPDRHPHRDAVLGELVEALLRSGEVGQAAELAEAVLARPHDPATDRGLRMSLIEALSLQNRPSELIAQGKAALERAADLSAADEAMVLAQTSYGYTFSGDLGHGERTARRALELAEQDGDVPMTVWGLTTLSVAVKSQGRYREALDLTKRAVQRAFEPPDEAARMRHPHFFLGLALADADRMDEAAVAYRKAAEECDELGSAWILPDTRLMSAELRFLVGDWQDAVPELEAGLDAAADHGALILVGQSRGYLAIMAAARGDRPAAEQALAPVQGDLTSDRPRYGFEIIGYAAALLAEAADRPAAALDVLKRLWHHDVGRENRYYHRYLAPALVRLGLELDPGGLAHDVADAAGDAAKLAPEVPTVQSAALRCRGLVDRDADVMLEAVELARRGRRILDHTAACEDGAAVLASTGRLADARSLLDEAIDRYEQIGAPSWAARANASLRALGGRRGSRGSRRRALTGWDSLTKSERAVAELVAEGLTNREVARRLYISPHTVNSHLRHVFQKLDVSTRAGLAAQVGRRGRAHSAD